MRHIAIACMLGLAVAGLYAEPAGDEDEVTEGAKLGELAQRQQLTKQDFERLTTEMLSLADELAEAEPDSAEILREAVKRARGAYEISEDMDKVVEYLRKGMTELATRSEGDVIEKLERVLRLLREGVTDMDRRMERIRQMEEMRKEVARMIEEQGVLERLSDVHARADDIEATLGELDARIAELIEAQRKLKERTGELGRPDEGVAQLAELRDELAEMIGEQAALAKKSAGAPDRERPLLAEKQEGLSKRAAEASEAIAEAKGSEAVRAALEEAKTGAEALDRASEGAAKAGERMHEAGEALRDAQTSTVGEAQKDALEKLTEAHQALSEAVEAAAKPTPAGGLAGDQKALAGETREASDAAGKAGGAARQPEEATPDLSGAAKEMDEAAEKLAGQDKSGAAGDQEEAIEKLKAERERLEELHRRMEEDLARKLADQKPPQDDLHRRADDLAEDMEGAEGGAMPGRKQMKGAAGAMGKAGGKLGKSDAGGANADQQEALERLREVEDELKRHVERERKMMQAEQLAKIDEMLVLILGEQQKISRATIATNARRGEDGFDREDQVKLGELAEGEAKLADDIRKISLMLANEGTTVVFPAILEEVEADLATVEERLSSRKAGALTQEMQAGVEESLRQMIDAMRKELAKRRKSDGGGGGGGGGAGDKPAPLVPPVAELKLLLALQLQVNDRTTVVARQVEGGDMPAAEAEDAHQNLAERQGNVEDMTRKVAERMELGRKTKVSP